MNCNDSRPLLNGYVDGEVGLDAALMIEGHLESCPGCGRELAQLRELRSALAKESLRFTAPPELVRMVTKLVGEDRPERADSWWRRWFGASGWVAAAAVAMVAVWVGLKPMAPEPGGAIANEVVASHVRSLMPGHLTDVVSTDQHTVKPWFDGRLDFSPQVEDFAAQGFDLIGGRLDYVAGRPVAALVYKRRKHLINLFEWPVHQGLEPALSESEHDGYHVIHWDRGGMSFWMVSNLNEAEMKQFAHLLGDQHT